MKLHTFLISLLVTALTFSGSVLASNTTQRLDIRADLQQRIDDRLQHAVETADVRQLAEQQARLRLKQMELIFTSDIESRNNIFSGPQAYKLLAILAK